MNIPREDKSYYSAHIVRYEWNSIHQKFVVLQNRIDGLIKQNPLDARYEVKKKIDDYLQNAISEEIKNVRFLKDIEALSSFDETKEKLNIISNIYSKLESYIAAEEREETSLEIERDIDAVESGYKNLIDENQKLKEDLEKKNQEVESEKNKYSELVAQVLNMQQSAKDRMYQEITEWEVLRDAMMMDSDGIVGHLKEKVEINIFRMKDALESMDGDIMEKVHEFSSARHLIQKEHIKILYSSHKPQVIDEVSFEQAPVLSNEHEEIAVVLEEVHDFSELESGPSFSSRFKESFRTKFTKAVNTFKTRPATAMLLAVATAGIIGATVGTAASSSRKNINDAPAPIAKNHTVKKVQPSAVKPDNKPQEKIQHTQEHEPTQKQLSRQVHNAVNAHPLRHASIGSYAPDKNGMTVYAGNWTVDTLMKHNPALDNIMNMHGGARSIKPVGFFKTKSGIKKAEGQTYANGHMGVTSSWGAVPMTFALEIEFNNGTATHVGIGSMLSPVVQQQTVAAAPALEQSFTPPTITQDTVVSPHIEMQKKAQNSLEHMKEKNTGQVDTKTALGKIGKFASGIKSKLSRFFG
ncbi:MAG: hypothetical protein ACK4NC_05355 [Candidatus Gracilibacteria bacterium]